MHAAQHARTPPIRPRAIPRDTQVERYVDLDIAQLRYACEGMRTLIAEGQALDAADITRQMTLADDASADLDESKLTRAMDQVRARLIAQHHAIDQSLQQARSHTNAYATRYGIYTLSDLCASDPPQLLSELIEALASDEHDGMVDPDPSRVPPQAIVIMEDAGMIERDPTTGWIRCHPLLRRGVADAS